MKKIFFLLLISLPNSAVGGRPIVDSLEREVKTISAKSSSFGRDTSLIWALTNLTFYSSYFREKQSKIYLDSLESICNKTNWKIGKGLMLFCKSSYLFWIKNDVDNAFKNALEAQKILENSNNLRALAYNHYRLSGLLLWQTLTIKNAGQSGLWHAQKVVEYGKKLNDKNLTCLGLAYEANHYSKLNKSIEALKILGEAETYIEHFNIDYLAITNVYGTLAGIYTALGNYEQSLKYIEKNLNVGKSQNDFYLLSSMWQYKGEIFAFFGKEKNLRKGISYLSQSYEYAQQLGEFQVLARVESLLYYANKLNGQTEQALHFLELARIHIDSVSVGKTQKIYADYDLATKEAKIKTLENDKLLTEANRQKWIRNLLIVSLLVGICLVFYFFQNNQKLKAKNREIEEALFKGQTIERKRVAEELHDNLSAKISGIKWRLEAIQPKFEVEKQRKIYDSSVIALAEVYTDVRLIAHNLLPAELETKGLKVAVENLIKEINSFDKTQFSLNISQEIGRYVNKIEYEFFSIILELSNNILKHSKAENATILLKIEQNSLKLIVSDNGIGINETNSRKGMGMENIKSRINSLNGKMNIENQNGVKVEIEVPV